MRGLGRNLLAGLLGGVVAGLVVVAIETCVVSLWWGDLPIAPPGLARTHMFDFFAELSASMPDSVGTLNPLFGRLVYSARTEGIIELLGGLAWCVLPWTAALGLLFAGWKFSRGMVARVAGSGLFVTGVAAAADLVSWALSIHFPSELSAYVVLRNIVRSFALDGEWVSVVTFTLSVALLWALAGRDPRRLGWGGRTVIAFLLVGFAGVCFLSGRASARREGAAPAGVQVSRQHRLPGRELGVGRPNILLVSIDSLRADHLGCYGWKHDTSPNIDALASSGVRFASAWSTTSWTLPSHVSMLSGRSLLGHGVLENGDAIPLSVPLLAGQLKSAGYRTAAFVSAPYLNSSYGFSKGFDLYDDRTVSFASHKESHAGITSPTLHRAVESWLRTEGRKGEAPFFLFIHYWDVHYDYTPPPPFDRMFDPDYRGSVTAEDFVRNARINRNMDRRDLDHVIALYDGEIRFTDGYVGKLLDLIEELGLAPETMIILTADHGDEFFEHGNKAHQRTLYEEVLHVPLIVSWLGTIEGGEVVDTPVSITDIMPTVLGTVGLPAPDGVEGTNLFEVSDTTRERLLVAEFYRKSTLNLQVALRWGKYKLIQSLNYPKLELFDLTSDPAEQRPVSGAKAGEPLRLAVARWLERHWDGYTAREARENHRTARVSAEHTDALRALGYIE